MDMNAIIENFKNVVTKHYVDFHGRARRSEFWWYILVVIVLQVILGIIQSFINTQILTGLLSLALLIGLGLNYLFGLWQADPLIGCLIALFLLKEGRRAVKEEKLCSCAACTLPPSEAETGQGG